MFNQEVLLKAILSTVARQSFPPGELYKLVCPRSGMAKQAKAFNLCDGSKTQSEIADAVGLDKGNFSKQVKRWIDVGIVVKVATEKGELPLHVYPIPETQIED
ncbi:MAG: MarR family transcriptional regulator [Hyphomonadaceae bacterium]|nr:MarR family transcriptional regulator [Hyphomonadaceae bacterium]